MWRQSQIQSDLRGMGTTLIAVALVAGNDGRDVVALANVGDSRGYVFSGGRISQITADHSLAEEKVRQGELTEAEAAVHPHRHILTRALGVAVDVEVDLWELRVQTGDRILLCSDGLTNEVDADRIAAVLGAVPDPTDAARALVKAAIEHGGNDNITVVVIDVVLGETDGSDALLGPAGAAAASAGPGQGPSPATGSGVSPAPQREVTPAGAPTVPAPAPGTQDGGGPGEITDSLTGLVMPPGALTASRNGLVTVDESATPEEEGERSSRRERRRERRRARRLAGIPRRVTFRVFLFSVLVVAVIAAAYGFVRWYATDNWYVTIKGDHLVIYQGRPGGLLGFEPKLVERSDVTTTEVLPFRIPALKANRQESSLPAARRYIANLQQEYTSQHRIASGQSTVPVTTVPSSTTTTSSPATTVPPGGPPSTTTSGTT